MNYFSDVQIESTNNCHFRPYLAFFGKITAVFLIWAAVASCTDTANGIETSAPNKDRIYRMEFTIRPDPLAGGAYVTLQVKQPGHYLRKLMINADPQEFGQFKGDGNLQVNGTQVSWELPAAGGSLSWFANIQHHRDGKSYDAYIEKDWAIFRGEDAIPAATSRAVKGARSDTELKFDLPSGWTALTEYAKHKNKYQITNPGRRFVTPTGWMLTGQIGTRTAIIAGVRVNIGAPMQQSIRRMDLIAFLNWNLPEVVRLLPNFPSRLTIISARDPMWRGGLSARQSFFLHGDRPLISENGSSAPLHEMMHVGLGIKAVPGADWIVEGLAEYYSIEILRRTGTMGKSRNLKTLQQVEDWSKSAKSVQKSRVGGAETARSVMIFKALDAEIREKSKQKYSLDDVARELAALNEPVSQPIIAAIVTRMIGEPSPNLEPENLDGQKK